MSIYDSHDFEQNANWGEQNMLHLAVTWQATDNLKITPSFYYSKDYSNDIDTFWFDIPKYTVNPGVFTNVVTLGTGATKFNFDFRTKPTPAAPMVPITSMATSRSVRAPISIIRTWPRGRIHTGTRRCTCHR